RTGALDAVEAYDTRSNTWSTVASSLAPHEAHASVLGKDGRIYLVGGEANGYGFVGCPSFDCLSYVEAYSPATRSWVIPPQMPTARFGLAAAVASDGRIFAFGGISTLGLKALNTVEAYAP